MKARKITGCQRDNQLMRKTLCRSALLGNVATLFGVAQDQIVHIQCVLEVFSDTHASECQSITVAWYLDIYESQFDPQTGLWQSDAGHAEVNKRFQSMNIIQILSLMFIAKGNLWCKIREGYIKYTKAQRLLGKFRKGKTLNEGQWVDRLLNRSKIECMCHKASWGYWFEGRT